MDLLFFAEISRRPPPSQCPAGPPRFADTEAARGWLDGERANLTAAISFVAAGDGAPRDAGLEARAIQLAATVERYLNFGHHLADATTTHINAL
jgi:hypothetical protein